jgi:hypothetical protein
MSITPEKIAEQGSESAHQQALFCWAALNKPEHPCLEDMFAIPNGGYRNEREAARLKLEGVRAGVPDVMLPAPVERYKVSPFHTTPDGRKVYIPAGEWYHGLFIELKVDANKPSTEQKYRIKRLQDAGYCCIVVYSWSEATGKILQYLKGIL